MPIQPGKLVVDPAKGVVVHAELDEGSASLTTAGSAGSADKRDQPVLVSSTQAPLRVRTDRPALPNPLTPYDFLLGAATTSEIAADEIEATASTYVKIEGFESGFPSGLWDREGTHQWDDVNCFPVEGGGSRSAWPAVNAVNPCTGGNYPANVTSWIEYGPFSLVGAQSAWLDLYFRLDSQSCTPITDCDYLFWGVSTNEVNYVGEFASGSHTGGLFQNGHNFASLDMSYLTGQSQVWIGIAFVSNGDGITGRGPFVDLISIRKNGDAGIYLTNQDFDIVEFPNQAWESFDNDGAANGDYRWDDVNCFAHSDGWSMWPADNGANAVDVCSGQQYPSNARSWLVHGPFSLQGASEAWVDFYFRNQSEVGFDQFWWAVSIDGSEYWGFPNSGNFTSGPHGNGYNLVRFDLSDVPTLGDLRGRSAVWLAFIFESDGSITGQGPFVDDVRVVIERPVVTVTYVPVVLKAPPSPQTKLFVKNETNSTVSYTVRSTPQGNITCSNIAAGTTKSCGTFTSGTYEVTVNTTQCGSNSGEVNFAPGNVTRVVRCVN
jgi:hypothetical protein